MRRGLAHLFAVLAAMTLSPVGAAAQDPPLETLACAAGYGCTGSEASQCDALAKLGLGSAGPARDLLALTYPAAFVELARNAPEPPTDCMEGTGSAGGGGGREADSSGSGGSGLPDYAQLAGHAETPCAGKVVIDPVFVPAQSDIRVLACFKGADNRYQECGQAPARAFCLMSGFRDVACFGNIKPAARAATVDAYCETGDCPAFGFIVCR